MDYFSKFLRPNLQPPPKQAYNHAEEFRKSWTIIYNTLTHPDERQLARGIKATGVPAALQTIVDSLVWECTRTEEGVTGACMEYLLKNDVLGTLVRLSEDDRPSGIQVEVLRTVQSMVVLLDEQFLVHSVVHRAVLRLLKTCVGDDIQEQLDGRNRVMGAAGNVVRASPTEYEKDLVDLLCLLCSRIRTFRELLMIFFYDKHWYRSETLASVPEEDGDGDDDDDDDDSGGKGIDGEEKPSSTAVSEATVSTERGPSPTPSQATVTSGPVSSQTRKPEYEFILLNYLLRFVHREGKIGEFARAGLLFLMDVAMSPGVPVHRIGGGDVRPLPSSASLHQQQQAPESDPVADAALALAEYILDGDFCEVLGAGLGAVYSLLPSKLQVRMEHQHRSAHPQHNAMSIGGTGPLSEQDWEKLDIAQEKAHASGIEYSSNPEFKARLEHFVKLLQFLQDVVRRNVSTSADDATIEPASFVGSAIVQSILDSVRRIFLENVLYPTILECSDADGSAVAVLSYIDVMFRTIQDQQFAETLIDFLVTEDDNDSLHHRPRTRPTLLLDSARSGPTVSTREKKVKRRKSSAMMLLEMDAPDARRQSEYFTSMGRFTLKDFLLTSMRSKSHATATAALQLMQTLLVHHCHLSVDRLFIFSYDPIDASSPNPLERKALSDGDDDDEFSYPGAEAEPMPRPNASLSKPEPMSRVPETSYSMHEQELGLYLGLVARIDPAHGRGAFSTGYDHYLRDAILSIACHSCSICTVDATDKVRPRHLLDVNDPVLSLILQSLRHFYSNTPEENMALTGILAAITSCPERSLKGWLLFGTDGAAQPSKQEAEVPQLFDDGDDRSVDFSVNERLMRNELPMPIYGAGPLSQPVVLSILQGLVSNLDRLRDLVPSFDFFLAERRQGLVFSENLTDALSLTFDLASNTVGMANSPGSTGVNAESTPPQRPKSKSRSGWSSFLTAKKSKSRVVSPSRPEPVASASSRGGTVEASPFGSHYQKTSSISVEALAAPLPASGPWAPSERRSFNMDEEDVFGASVQWGEEKRSDVSGLTRAPEQEESNKTVSLSQLLDSVVILEESIKELTAIVHSRRSLGIDSLRYM